MIVLHYDTGSHHQSKDEEKEPGLRQEKLNRVIEQVSRGVNYLDYGTEGHSSTE